MTLYEASSEHKRILRKLKEIEFELITMRRTSLTNLIYRTV